MTSTTANAVTASGAKPIAVVVAGALGRMGAEVVKAVLAAPDCQLVGAIDTTPGKEGADVGLELGLGALEVAITADFEGSLCQASQAVRNDGPGGGAVLVDFTHPSVVFEHTRAAIAYGVHPVIGTTGLSPEQLADLASFAEKASMGGAVIPNFSVGMVLLQQAAAAEGGAGQNRSMFMDVYAMAARAHMERYGTTKRQLAAVASKNSFHGSLNPRAQFREVLSVDDVLAAPMIAEPLTRLGAGVVAIDASATNIGVARAHAAESELVIDYRHGAAEELAARGETFDAVLALEIVEHVADLEAFLGAAAALTRSGGGLVVATLNRTPQSYLLAIVGAEYVLRWLPIGTHDWKKFVRPSELGGTLRHHRIEERSPLIGDPSAGHGPGKPNIRIGENPGEVPGRESGPQDAHVGLCEGF